MWSIPENSLAALDSTVSSSLYFFEVANKIQAGGHPEAMTPQLVAGER